MKSFLGKFRKVAPDEKPLVTEAEEAVLVEELEGGVQAERKLSLAELKEAWKTARGKSSQVLIRQEEEPTNEHIKEATRLAAERFNITKGCKPVLKEEQKHGVTYYFLKQQAADGEENYVYEQRLTNPSQMTPVRYSKEQILRVLVDPSVMAITEYRRDKLMAEYINVYGEPLNSNVYSSLRPHKRGVGYVFEVRSLFDEEDLVADPIVVNAETLLKQYREIRKEAQGIHKRLQESKAAATAAEDDIFVNISQLELDYSPPLTAVFGQVVRGKSGLIGNAPHELLTHSIV